MTAVGDTKEGFQRLCDAVRILDQEESFKKADSDRREREKTEILQSASPYMELEQCMGITEALEKESQVWILEKSAGKISAEFVYLYPPGIPILAPGEQITECLIENVKRYLELGLEVQGLCDYTGQTICVVKE